jgi:hypothetical protein
MSLLPAAYLAKKLTKPLPIKAGGVLRTVKCAADYMLALDPAHAEGRQHWRHCGSAP